MFLDMNRENHGESHGVWDLKTLQVVEQQQADIKKLEAASPDFCDAVTYCILRPMLLTGSHGSCGGNIEDIDLMVSRNSKMWQTSDRLG